MEYLNEEFLEVSRKYFNFQQEILRIIKDSGLDLDSVEINVKSGVKIPNGEISYIEGVKQFVKFKYEN